MNYAARYESPLGPMLLACEGDDLVGAWFEGQKHFRESAPGDMADDPSRPALVAAAAWLDAYFGGKRPSASALSLAPSGSAFRRAVWEILRSIPYGRTLSYGRIAELLGPGGGGRGGSSRAVGGAVGRNPISIIIPCHRVVGSDGSLTGYAGGLERKIALLGLEGAEFARPREG